MAFGFLFGRKRAGDAGEDFIKQITEDLVLIPSGSYLMGSNDGEDDERPIHNVLVESFAMEKHEVTQKQWYDLMGTQPWQGLEYIHEGDNYPAVNISWYDVKAFIRKLNKKFGKKFRLPTEAEWEYACRAGSSSKFSHGSYKMNLSRYAWFYDNAFKENEMYAHEVGTRKPNKWGLYDMLGNIYEWCSDWYSRNYYNK